MPKHQAKNKDAEKPEHIQDDVAHTLHIMEKSMQDAVVAAKCCKFLAEEACRSGNGGYPDPWPHLNKATTIRLVINVVKNHPADPKLQEGAWLLLDEVCRKSAQNREVLFKEGAFQALVATMNLQRQNTKILEIVCKICCTMLIPKRVLEGDVAHSAALALINTIRAHHTKGGSILRFAMGALNHLFAEHKKAHIPKEAAIQACTLGMRAATQGFHEQLFGCLILRHLCEEDDKHVMETMWREGVVNLVLTALDLFTSTQAHMANHARSLEDTLRKCTATISYVQAHAMEPRTEPGLSVISRAMRMFPQCIELQGSATKFLRDAVMNHIDNATHMGKGGLEAVFAAMRVFKTPSSDSQPNTLLREQQFQAAALFVIHIAMKARDPHILEVLMRPECAQAVIAVMDAYHADIFVVRQGCFALLYFVNMPVSKEVKSRIRQEAVETVLSAITTYKDDYLMFTSGCTFLILGMHEWVGSSRTHDDTMGLRVLYAAVEALLRREIFMDGYFEDLLCRYIVGVCGWDKQDLNEERLMLLCTGFVTHGGIQLLLRTLTTSADNMGWDEWYKRATLTTGVLTLMVNGNRRGQDICGREGGIEVLVRLVAKHKEKNEHLTTGICLLLDSLSLNHEENTQKIVKLRGIKHIHRVSKNEHLEHDSDVGPIMLRVFAGFRSRNLGLFEAVEERDRQKLAEACVACGKTAGGLGLSRLLRCSACTVAPLYCSSECQKACWKAHKAECKANRKHA
jgi:hypothetical protein